MSLISSTKTAANTVELQVSISAEEFAKAVDAVYNKNKKKISVPGFRQGKAPRSFI